MERFVPGDDLPSEFIGKLPAYKLPVNPRTGELLESVNERRLYQPIVEGIRETLKLLGCDTLMAYQTDTYGDTVAPGSDESRDSIPFKPDITIYPTTSEAKEHYTLPLKPETIVPSPDQDGRGGEDGGTSCGYPSTKRPDANLNVPEDSNHPTPAPSNQPFESGVSRTLDVGGDSVAREHLEARMSWANAEIIIEVKGNRRRAPFSVMIPKESSESGSDILRGVERRLARGQATHYGVGIFNRQHRQHLFVLSIVYNIARIIYFDRSGAVYSRAFDHYKDPVTLATFFYRYSKMSPEERGYDPTASLASESELVLFRKLWETYPGSAMAKRNPVPVSALQHAGTQGWPVTRGFVAYDLTDKRVVYIKDSWRAVSKDLPPEFDNYRRLYDRLPSDGSVTGLLTVLAGGDVQPPTFQHTRTQDFFDNELATAPLMRRHQRLVFKEVCRRLEEFKTAYELCNVLFGALFTYQFAWEKAEILHRDISASNILIYDAPTGSLGVLADWDLAKTKDRLSNQNATQPSRSGTWQFLSALRQCFPMTPCRLSDDLESFMHVINWIARKYLKHDATSKDPEQIRMQCKRFHDIYDERAPPADTPRMSKVHSKMDYILSGTPFVRVHPLRPDNPLDTLLRSLLKLCQAHYQSDEIREIWVEPPSRAPPSPPAPARALVIVERFLDALDVDEEWWSQIEKTPDQVVSWTPAMHYIPSATGDSTESGVSNTGSKRALDSSL
ncbi:hypothetical protein C8Q79DRAFT_1006084 [Trametes meyenii]|nr:hypothetical protein C8Q79DRAFT_1006084 [Trametes meyenii]